MGTNYAAGYEYDAATGRMNRVTGPGLPAFGAWYGYMLNGSEEPGADLVTTLEFRSDANNTVARTVRGYEAQRNLRRKRGRESLIVATETIVGGANGYSLTVTRNYEDGTGGTVAGRSAGFSIGADYGVTYQYDPATGRLNKITGTGLPTYGVTYGYTANSDLVGSTQFMVAPSTPAVTVTRTYDPHRPLLTAVENDTVEPISRYAYQYDAVGRRTSVLNTGSAFSAAAYNLWGYNDRGELTSSKRYTGTQVPVPPNLPDPEVTGERRLYTYDTIGNRKDRTESTGAALYYCANNLNQYVTTDELATCPAQPPATESFTHDLDGNLTQDGRYTYTWDCENRLTAVAKPSPGAGDKKVVYGYDYQGRRVRRQAFAWNTGSGSWETTPESDQRFVYDGWNVVLVLNGLTSNSIQTKYTWGLDLAGQSGGAGILPASGIHGAGGIGGLLAAVETQGTYQGTYWYLYDGNGNVGQVLSATTYNVVAHYEYDPYGNAIVAAGNYAAANPYRFSTKQWDDETGLGYWGYRYYSPTTGRWLSRDRIEELGGLNLYAYVRSSPVASVDPLGQFILPEPPAPPPPPATCEQRHANCMACAAGRNSECLSRGYSLCLTYCAVRYRWCWGSFNTGFNQCLITCYGSFYKPACDRDDGANTAYCDKKLAWCQGKGPDPGYGWGIGPGGGCPF